MGYYGALVSAGADEAGANGREDEDMRNSWPIVIGVIAVGLNALVFVQEWHAYRAAAPGANAGFPIWTLLTLIAAAAYLLGAGILYDRARRKP